MEEHRVQYGDEVIQFTLKRKNVKNVNLNVRPDTTVTVSAHHDVPLAIILQFVQRKAGWIVKQVDRFKEVQPQQRSEREYVSGESFRYLGKQYRLRVAAAEKEGVKYFRGFIYLYVKDTRHRQRKAKLLHDWYRKKAANVFRESLDSMFSKVEKYGVVKPDIRIRMMKARWGSCLLHANAISLNFALIKAPKHCIDYVVLHELVHFIHNDHSDKFYNLLDALMPDWKQRKTVLDKEVAREL